MSPENLLEQRSPIEAGQSLSGRCAVVTGGNRGIGRAIAQALAAAGARVAIGGRDRKASETCRQEIESQGGTCLSSYLDVKDESSISDFMGQVEQSLGQVDILVNNAGIYKTEAVRNHSLSLWNDIMHTNLTGAMLTCRQVLEKMIGKNWGRIINISSISGKVGEINGSAYSASKFGLIGLTQSLALEVARYNITANAICPGWVLTDMARSQLEDDLWCADNSMSPADSLELTRLSVPQMRFIDPQEIAELTVFLCGDAARGITGQAINVCGGLSLH